jgi:hypothetical protein
LRMGTGDQALADELGVAALALQVLHPPTREGALFVCAGDHPHPVDLA